MKKNDIIYKYIHKKGLKIKKIFKNFITFFSNEIKKMPDKRKGKNISYQIKDIVLSAFSMFYMQSASFLQFQRKMEKGYGKNNARSLFGIEKIPTPNHIRDIIDNIEIKYLEPMYNEQLKYLQKSDLLGAYKYNDKYVVAIDGTEYYSSKEIHCEKCLIKIHNEVTTYSHQAITPILIPSNDQEIIPLMPELIENTDGSKKQDCEINASKRWLSNNKSIIKSMILLGDDLYSHEPFCKDVINAKNSFIFVAKEKSHKIMYENIKFLENTVKLDEFETTVGRAHKKAIWKYKFINKVPINGNEDSLDVNWFELEIFKANKKIYHNAFITDMEITTKNIHDFGVIGKKRWMIENENNNILKTKGYNLEHNFGHGKKNLAGMMLALNILAFLFHTVLNLLDENYKKARAKCPRYEFFRDMQVLTKLCYFPSWEALIKSMAGNKDSPPPLLYHY